MVEFEKFSFSLPISFDQKANNGSPSSTIRQVKHTYIMSNKVETTKLPTFELIVDVYLKGLAGTLDNFDEKEYLTLVVQWRQEFDDDEEVLAFLETMHPEFGHPHDYFDKSYDHSTSEAQIADKAATKARKHVELATKWAQVEYANKLRCAEAEAAAQKEQSETSALTTQKQCVEGFVSATSRLPITKGDYVSVSPDLSPGMCSQGGYGWVKEVCGGYGHITCTVEYVLGKESGRMVKESGIPLSRLTKQQFLESGDIKRRRVSAAAYTSNNMEEEQSNTTKRTLATLKDELQKGFSQQRGPGFEQRICVCMILLVLPRMPP